MIRNINSVVYAFVAIILSVCNAALGCDAGFRVTTGLLSSSVDPRFDSIDIIVCIENMYNEDRCVDLCTFFPFDCNIYVDGRLVSPIKLNENQSEQRDYPSEFVTIKRDGVYIWKTKLPLCRLPSDVISDGFLRIEFNGQSYWLEKKTKGSTDQP